jgi:tetratricopeptide (TPR) repeat protein
MLSPAEAEQLVRSGWAALQQGDAAGAKARLGQLVAANRVNAQVLLLYAAACRGTGDAREEEQAIDRLLEDQPGNLRALVVKGDCRDRSGDHGGATSFFQRALAVAAQAGELPDDLKTEMQRIDTRLAEGRRRYKEHLEGSLARAGIEVAGRSPRFQQSLDLLTGEKQLYVQQPNVYYFPELPQRQYYEREEFAWTRPLEAATDAIVSEVRALMAGSREDFRPYLVSNKDRPQSAYHGLADNPDWSSFYLWENGGPVEANVERCPRTFEAIGALPLARIGTRAPVVMFSWLKAGARIPPHSGSMNARLICHLPLIVPDGCGFRVGNEARQWEVGKTLIFDDTIEHEAWNDSGEDRVVLIFDIWRPELDDEERRAIVAMFEAVDEFRPS